MFSAQPPSFQQQQSYRYPMNPFGYSIPAYYVGTPAQIYSIPSFQDYLPLGYIMTYPFSSHIVSDLVQAHHRDHSLDQMVKTLVDSTLLTRSTDTTIRNIMQGRPMDMQDIVRDILSDRLKDHALSKLVSLVLEDRDDALGAVLGVPIDERMMGQRRFDLKVAQVFQGILMNDVALQFQGTELGEPGNGSNPKFAHASVQCPPTSHPLPPPSSVEAPWPLSGCYNDGQRKNPGEKAMETAQNMMAKQLERYDIGPDISSIVAEIATKKFHRE